jgi:hypothetical protein
MSLKEKSGGTNYQSDQAAKQGGFFIYEVYMSLITMSDYFHNKNNFRAVYKGTNLDAQNAYSFFKEARHRLINFTGQFYYNLENDGEVEHEITIDANFFYNYERNPIEEQKGVLYTPSWDTVKVARIGNHELFCYVSNITSKEKDTCSWGFCNICIHLKKAFKYDALVYLTELIDRRCKDYAELETTTHRKRKYRL